MTTPRFLSIPGYEGFYEIAEDGSEVRSMDRTITTVYGQIKNLAGKVLSFKYTATGSAYVALSMGGFQRLYSVDELLFAAKAGLNPNGSAYAAMSIHTFTLPIIVDKKAYKELNTAWGNANVVQFRQPEPKSAPAQVGGIGGVLRKLFG